MKYYLILISIVSITACTDNTKHFNFDQLPVEIINKPNDSVTTDTTGVKLPEAASISSMANKFDIRNQLMVYGDSICKVHGKKINPDNISNDDHTKLVAFANEILSNDNTGTRVEIEVDGERLEYEHIKTEYADLDFEFKLPNQPYRHYATINYHFKLSLNKDEDKAEAMKHLMYVYPGTVYSPEKLDEVNPSYSCAFHYGCNNH